MVCFSLNKALFVRLTASNCGEIKVSGLNKSAESAGSVLYVSACPGCFVALVESEHPLMH